MRDQRLALRARTLLTALALSGGLLRSQVRPRLLAALDGEVGPVQHVTDPVAGAVALVIFGLIPPAAAAG